eukprot:m.95741 g.95741  ORF g.95741 m.95741 type:complete len:535 (-) comp13512_c0_seq2:208-1812(-)
MEAANPQACTENANDSHDASRSASPKTSPITQQQIRAKFGSAMQLESIGDTQGALSSYLALLKQISMTIPDNIEISKDEDGEFSDKVLVQKLKVAKYCIEGSQALLKKKANHLSDTNRSPTPDLVASPRGSNDGLKAIDRGVDEQLTKRTSGCIEPQGLDVQISNKLSAGTEPHRGSNAKELSTMKSIHETHTKIGPTSNKVPGREVYIEAAQRANRAMIQAFENQLKTCKWQPSFEARMRLSIERRMQENILLARRRQETYNVKLKQEQEAAAARAMAKNTEMLDALRKEVRLQPGSTDCLIGLAAGVLHCCPELWVELRSLLHVATSRSGPLPSLEDLRGAIDQAVVTIATHIQELQSEAGQSVLFNLLVDVVFDHDENFLVSATEKVPRVQSQIQSYERCKALTPDEMDIKPNLVHCDFEPAVLELRRATISFNPVKVQNALVKTMMKIAEIAAARDVSALGADDMVPVLILVLVRAYVKDLPLRICLCEIFSSEKTLIGEQGYALVTFGMALEFLVSRENKLEEGSKEKS